jgi:AraC family transcriptional regulator, regulatory protein of adaptative response / DNA-3-methyladenine glycosylase II
VDESASTPRDGWHELRLEFRPPLARTDLVEFLAARAVPGVEEVADGVYRRSLRLPGGPAVVELAVGCDTGTGDGSVAGRHRHARGPVAGRVRLAEAGDRAAALAACRRLLDLDADPRSVDTALGTDQLLAPLVRTTPGRRAPGHVDAHELAFRAVLGQQVSLAAARRLAAELAGLCGDRLSSPAGSVTHVFPTAAAVADADLERIGMPGSRRATLRALADALAGGRIALGPGADPVEAERRLLELRGVGPWTAAYVRMRGLGDPDVLLVTDLGIRHALAALGVPRPADVADRWRPWRSYAGHHLWASLAGGGTTTTRPRRAARKPLRG